jgi:hypothetical protein
MLCICSPPNSMAPATIVSIMDNISIPVGVHNVHTSPWNLR